MHVKMARMALGLHCKTLGIDEEVLAGTKEFTCDVKELTNGVAFDLHKYKNNKKLNTKDIMHWMTKIFSLTCEDEGLVEKELSGRYKKLLHLRNTFQKNPKNYPGELDRLMKWQFDIPPSMGAEPVPCFEPAARASLGPKLLKVLKAADNDDSMDVSGGSDDDDEQVKRRKAREELVLLKRDLGIAKRAVTGLSDRLNDLTKRCLHLRDVSKSSVSERRRIESDIVKLRNEWNVEIVAWHNCIERLNHVNTNKGNYMDVGYMVRRNKSKQGIFDELNFEFEKAVEEFVHKINSFLDRERRKKKPVPREYRQKNKKDRKRVRPENEENEEDESKKMCLSEEVKEEDRSLTPEEFVKNEKIEEFKGGRFSNSLRVIYNELLAMPIPCKALHKVIFEVLSVMEKLNVDKIPTPSFAGNIFMEARAMAMIEAYSDVIKLNKVNVVNDGTTKFELVGTFYNVILPEEKRLQLGIRDLSDGSPDTSLGVLKDFFTQLMSQNFEMADYASFSALSQSIRMAVVSHKVLDRTTKEVLFSYKQQITPKIQACMTETNTSADSQALQQQLTTLNNFCTGVHFLCGLSELVDVTVLAWEQMTQSVTSDVDHKSHQILSFAVQQLYNFCESVDPLLESSENGKEFNMFIKKEKKLANELFAPFRNNIFNSVFHNTASLWFLHETGLLNDFLEQQKENQVKLEPIFETCNESHFVAVMHALGLIGKLLVVPMWTVFEDQNTDITPRYTTLLKKVEAWSKDATSFMKGLDHPFEDVPLSYDAVFVSLIKENEASQTLTKELLEILFLAFTYFIKSFLFGSSKTTDSTNLNGDVTAESNTDLKIPIHKDFSAFDRISKSMHTSSTFALDALMTYSKDKNAEWQDKLCGSNNLKIFELIQKTTNKQLKLLYKRKVELNSIKEQSQKWQEELSKCQLIEKWYKFTDDLMKWGGLWKSEKEADDRLKGMKEIDRMNALKAQIRFRRHVLGEAYENGLLDLAHDGECFNATKLYENLIAVIKNECHQTETDVFELSSATDDESLKTQIYDQCKNALEITGDDESKVYSIKENFYWLLGKLVSHTFVDSDGKVTLSGVCIARKKVNGVYFYFMRFTERDKVYKFNENKIHDDYKSKNLSVVDPMPKNFVGSQLSRAIFKDDGDLEWHDCNVIDTVGHGPEYVIEFDYYGSSVQIPVDNTQVPKIDALTFTSHLLEDYRTDRLRFL